MITFGDTNLLFKMGDQDPIIYLGDTLMYPLSGVTIHKYKTIPSVTSGSPVCDGVDKIMHVTTEYNKFRYSSDDGGVTWHTTSKETTATTYDTVILEQNSTDCGYGEKWVSEGETECVGTSLYAKETKMYTTDSGETWVYTSPKEQRVGELIEEGSSSCQSSSLVYDSYKAVLDCGSSYCYATDGGGLIIKKNSSFTVSKNNSYHTGFTSCAGTTIEKTDGSPFMEGERVTFIVNGSSQVNRTPLLSMHVKNYETGSTILKYGTNEIKTSYYATAILADTYSSMTFVEYKCNIILIGVGVSDTWHTNIDLTS